MIKIDTGVPVKSPYKYPFQTMNIGDSFFVPEPTNPMSVRVAAYQYAGRHQIKFVTRLLEEGKKTGVRVWRIA